MIKCEKCCGKRYIGLKKHECMPGQASTAEPCPNCSSGQFPTWKTIRTGVHSSVTELRAQLNDVYFGHPAETIFRELSLGAQEKELELVSVTCEDLGFSSPVFIWQIILNAQRAGLTLCPQEVGPQLCWQHGHRYESGLVLVCSSPLFDQNGNHRMFMVKTESDRGVSLFCPDMRGGDRGFPADMQFCFARIL